MKESISKSSEEENNIENSNSRKSPWSPELQISTNEFTGEGNIDYIMS